MLNKNLIRKINTGRCLVLVGSGLSCEIGYPSWHRLAEQTYQQLTNSGVPIDDNSYRKYLDNSKYAELFRQIQRDLGENRQALIDLIKPLLISKTKKKGMLYELIARWPFVCYLTTNYDDEIRVALATSQQYFTVIQNAPKCPSGDFMSRMNRLSGAPS